MSGVTDPAKSLPEMFPEFARLWMLAMASDPAEIAELEALTGETQAAAVDHLIEDSCWRQDLPHLTGGRGTPAERQAALRAAWEAQERRTA